MTKICTSIKQSKKLIELGINPHSADMCLIDHMKILKSSIVADKSQHNDLSIIDGILEDADLPAWSLSALLKLMPKSICIKTSEYAGYFYFLEWQFANDNSLRYIGNDRNCLVDIYSDHDEDPKDEIDIAVEMVCWLKKNGKI